MEKNCLLTLNKNLIDWNYEDEEEENTGNFDDDDDDDVKTFEKELKSAQSNTNESDTSKRTATNQNEIVSGKPGTEDNATNTHYNHSIKLIDLREFNPLLNSEINTLNSVFNENLNNIRAKLFNLNSFISILPSNLIYMPRNYLYNSYIYVNKNSLIYKHVCGLNECKPNENETKFCSNSNNRQSIVQSSSKILNSLKNRNRLNVLFNSFIRTMKCLIMTKSVFLLPFLLLFLNVKLKQFYLTSSISSSSTISPTLTTASTATAAVAATASFNSLLSYYFTR